VYYRHTLVDSIRQCSTGRKGDSLVDAAKRCLQTHGKREK